jgi:hypothetical protein
LALLAQDGCIAFAAPGDLFTLHAAGTRAPDMPLTLRSP